MRKYLVLLFLLFFGLSLFSNDKIASLKKVKSKDQKGISFIFPVDKDGNASYGYIKYDKSSYINMLKSPYSTRFDPEVFSKSYLWPTWEKSLIGVSTIFGVTFLGLGVYVSIHTYYEVTDKFDLNDEGDQGTLGGYIALIVALGGGGLATLIIMLATRIFSRVKARQSLIKKLNGDKVASQKRKISIAPIFNINSTEGNFETGLSIKL